MTSGKTKKIALSKKQLTLIVVLALSALVALITLCLMDFSSFGIPKIKKLTGKGLIDSKIFYSGEKLYAYFENFNQDALNAVLLVHGIDYVFMFSVCVFEVALLLLIAKIDYKAVFLAVFAFLELLFDISENLFVDIVVRKLPEQTKMIAGLSGGMTLFKWIFVGLFVLSVVILLCVAIRKKRKAKGIQTPDENATESKTPCDENVAENNDDINIE